MCFIRFSHEDLLQDTTPLQNSSISDKGIEQIKDVLGTDFANRVIGGGVFRGGCVQVNKENSLLILMISSNIFGGFV